MVKRLNSFFHSLILSFQRSALVFSFQRSALVFSFQLSAMFHVCTHEVGMGEFDKVDSKIIKI